jgi:TctA family transporter
MSVAFDSLFALLGQGPLLLTLLVGIALGTVIGILPGISGRMGILFLFPVLPGLSPEEGIVLLISMHAVVHTGGSLPSILFGMPGSGADAATVVDGYPMTRRGLGGEALGASFSASAVGGVVGALVLVALLPAARGIATSLGAPEYLLISLLGLCAAVVLAGRSPLKGLAIAARALHEALLGGPDRDSFV